MAILRKYVINFSCLIFLRKTERDLGLTEQEQIILPNPGSFIQLPSYLLKIAKKLLLRR